MVKVGSWQWAVDTTIHQFNNLTIASNLLKNILRTLVLAGVIVTVFLFSRFFADLQGLLQDKRVIKNNEQHKEMILNPIKTKPKTTVFIIYK